MTKETREFLKELKDIGSAHILALRINENAPMIVNSISRFEEAMMWAEKALSIKEASLKIKEEKELNNG